MPEWAFGFSSLSSPLFFFYSSPSRVSRFLWDLSLGHSRSSALGRRLRLQGALPRPTTLPAFASPRGDESRASKLPPDSNPNVRIDPHTDPTTGLGGGGIVEGGDGTQAVEESDGKGEEVLSQPRKLCKKQWTVLNLLKH